MTTRAPLSASDRAFIRQRRDAAARQEIEQRGGLKMVERNEIALERMTDPADELRGAAIRAGKQRKRLEEGVTVARRTSIMATDGQGQDIL